MAPRPRWWHILQESRRQACVAVDFYNRSGTERSYLDFVVHMHLAWQYLLHAECDQQKRDYVFRDDRGRIQRIRDGGEKTWDLQRCLQWRFPTEADPTRVNAEFFIGLRNRIEHRYQDSLMVATAGKAHAYVVNYETELVAAFGDQQSLSAYLRFPVFVQNLSPAGVKEQLATRRRLPKAVQSYIIRFEHNLDRRVTESERYDYRVMLVQVKGPKSEADSAMTFVRAEDLTEDKRKQMEAEGKIGTSVVVEKHRDVMYSDELTPAEVVTLLATKSPFIINMWHFTELCKRHKVKPAKGDPPEKTDPRYCLYDKPWKKYVYTQAFVRLAIEDVTTRDRFVEAFGKEPRAKVASLAARAETKAAEKDLSASSAGTAV